MSVINSLSHDDDDEIIFLYAGLHMSKYVTCSCYFPAALDRRERKCRKLIASGAASQSQGLCIRFISMHAQQVFGRGF